MITRDGLRMRAVGRDTKPPATARDELRDTHESAHAFVPHANAARMQGALQPEPSVGLPALRVGDPP
jgi:hypothetical protein